MMTTRNAACSCGQLQATTSGDPVRISVCHCLACQRRTGSVFGMQARFPRAQVRERWQASGASVVVTGDAGAVYVQLGREGVAVRSERDRRHHYWSHISMVNQVSARYSSPQF